MSATQLNSMPISITHLYEIVLASHSLHFVADGLDRFYWPRIGLIDVAPGFVYHLLHLVVGYPLLAETANALQVNSRDLNWDKN
jgi:hypothetical protein